MPPTAVLQSDRDCRSAHFCGYKCFEIVLPLYILYVFLSRITYFSCRFDEQQTVFVKISKYFVWTEIEKNAKTVAVNLIKSITSQSKSKFLNAIVSTCFFFHFCSVC